MRKNIAILITALILPTFFTSCSDPNAVDTWSAASDDQSSPLTMTNHMTDAERGRVRVHDITLLDEESAVSHEVCIEFRMTDDQPEPVFTTVDDIFYDGCTPPPTYTGGEFEFGGVSFGTAEEYFNSISADPDDQKRRLAEIIFNAVLNKTYSAFDEGTIDRNALHDGGIIEDNRDKWAFDRAAVEELRSSIREVSMYDEALDTDFLVHVTLPPNYDNDRKYPVFFTIGGERSFGDHTVLRKLMEERGSAELILVSLGFDYMIDGSDSEVHDRYYVDKRSEMLDFVTDDLMPYLSGIYSFDCENSAIYSCFPDSCFTGYALEESGRYANQPFGRYVFSSMENIGTDKLEAVGTYGSGASYRTEQGKDVFVCADNVDISGLVGDMYPLVEE